MNMSRMEDACFPQVCFRHLTREGSQNATSHERCRRALKSQECETHSEFRMPTACWVLGRVFDEIDGRFAVAVNVNGNEVESSCKSAVISAAPIDGKGTSQKPACSELTTTRACITETRPLWESRADARSCIRYALSASLCPHYCGVPSVARRCPVRCQYIDTPTTFQCLFLLAVFPDFWVMWLFLFTVFTFDVRAFWTRLCFNVSELLCLLMPAHTARRH